ncbi:unnamed protein product [Rotaria sordida]|uniref:Uncharacterized protein n=1 Tax=Rotaria sordida TaxID=392033 RepID=A0A814Y5G0_9BILA|nr:unnamed protein product [Rotaria sordida]
MNLFYNNSNYYKIFFSFHNVIVISFDANYVCFKVIYCNNYSAVLQFFPDDDNSDDALTYNYQLQQQRLRVKGRMSQIHPRQCEQVRTVLQICKDQQISSIVSSVEQQTLE